LSTNIILFTLFIIVLFLMAYRKETKKRIIFFGDSITEQGKALTGYISLINRQIETEGLVKKFQTIGCGISGNRVYDLCFRIDEDVVAKSPSITVVYIGINDVWGKQKTGTGLDIERYEKFYRNIIMKLLSANSKIVLCTISVIGENKFQTNAQDNDLNAYSEVVKKLAKEYSVTLCDLREAFVNYIDQNNYENVAEGLLTTDGVHLNEEGNKLVATRMWEAIKNVNL
jgi:lysophospholipase L1-like esterase